ncbi:MAG: MFS transporter, partial [Chloroflexi bacterium]|nr:MFS transporter [Chloroflexota bacterium]
SITLLMLCQMGMVFGITQYMQFVLGYSALETGIRFLPSAAGVAIGASMSHRRVEHFGTTRVMAVAFIAYTALFAGASFWDVDTSYWVLGPMFFATGLCMGHIMPPATDALLGAVAEARSGVGSAMNSVSVQVGGAIGVAALGSVLSSIYSSNVKPAIAAIPSLPTEVARAATDSVGVAIIASDRLPDGASQALSSAARGSFMDGWQVMAFAVCGIGLAAAFFVMRFMPPRHLPVEAADALSSPLRGEEKSLP